jgi:hypothetical protein
MVSEARSAGLLVNPEKLAGILGRANDHHATPDPAAPIHNSMKGWWWAELPPRRYTSLKTAERRRKWKIPLGRRRFIADGALIHQSVFERMARVPGYQPRNLPLNHTAADASR